MASNKGRAFFALSGYHFNPDDITRLLGVEPTSVNAAGARSGMDRPIISSWELSTDEVSDYVDVYALTDIITKQIEPVKDKILQVIQSHNLSPRIGVVLTLSVDNLFEYQDNIIVYSARREVEYMNQDVEMCIYYPNDGQFIPGEYTATLYADGYMIGSAEFLLK